MLEITCALPELKTMQELDEEIQHYLESDLTGVELFCHWQAIRNASLNLDSLASEPDSVPGADSY